MHDAALKFVADFAAITGLETAEVTAVDIGGRETNGHARWVFRNADWTVVDAADGLGVDVVADGASWQPPELVDLVLYAEVGEHTPSNAAIIANICMMLKPGGTCVMTMAGPGREVHGLHHDDPLTPGGWYQNVQPDELEYALQAAGFSEWEVDQLGEDVRAWARR